MAKTKDSKRYVSAYKKNANYDAEQKEPKTCMGSGSFANLPGKPMFAGFGEPVYRDGLINSFTSGVNELSEVDENNSGRVHGYD